MNLQFVAALAVFLTAAIGQRYKVIDLEGGVYSTFQLDHYGIFPQDDKLIFEMRTCTYGKAWMTFGVEKNWIYQMEMLPSTTGNISFKALKFGANPSLTALYDNPLDCNTFQKFKVGWKNANFRVWVYDKMGWINVFEWVDHSPKMDDVKRITATKHGGIALKIHALKHSTTPHTVTCVEFY